MDPAHKSPLGPVFPVGSEVVIAPRIELEEFRRTWRFHHPLSEVQIEQAGRKAVVITAGMYHGGDLLYELSDTPGYWHRQNLRSGRLPIPHAGRG